jgi:hypothetical protein
MFLTMGFFYKKFHSEIRCNFFINISLQEGMKGLLKCNFFN